MTYSYLSNGLYLWQGAPERFDDLDRAIALESTTAGIVFRWDGFRGANQKQKCDPKSGTVLCGSVCRTPKNCKKKPQGFKPTPNTLAIPTKRENAIRGRIQTLGKGVADRVKDRHFQQHMATHLAENVAAWGIGRVGGAALAHVAQAHGINPEVASIGGEAIVQALAGTAIKAIVDKNSRNPKAMAVGLASELGAALAGKIAHHQAAHLLEEGSRQFAKVVGPLFAGKAAGIGTKTGVAGTAKKLLRTDSLGTLTDEDLATLWMLAIVGLSVKYSL